MTSLRNQIARHSVALISLFVALSSLAYNTWRNEQSEENRNVRAAGFELILKLGELDRIVFYSHYDHDLANGNPRTGWSIALTVKDLGSLMHDPASDATIALLETWKENWAGLGIDDLAAKRISDRIDQTRASVLVVLADLD